MSVDPRGMSYEQASRLGLVLVKRAAETECWWPLVDDLAAIRTQMQREMSRQPKQVAIEHKADVQ